MGGKSNLSYGFIFRGWVPQLYHNIDLAIHPTQIHTII